MKDDQEFNETLPALPNAKYQKLFSQFTEIETLPTAQWRVNHILGYFVKKFKETFGVEYKFKFNHQLPSKSFEVWQVKSLSGKLSSNPEILKEYIDWFYGEIAAAKKRFTSISAMTKDEMTNKYKWEVLTAPKSALSLDRATMLPDNYQAILTANNLTIKTYGDLAFLYQADREEIKLKTALDQLISIGFDVALLEKIV